MPAVLVAGAVAAGTVDVRPGRLSPGVDVAAGAGEVKPGMPSPGVELAAGVGEVSW